MTGPRLTAPSAPGVLLMAGGEGQRLGPLTERTPKPMLPVAGRPVLQHLVEHLRDQGVERVHIAVRHLAHVVVDHFGDGRWLGVGIDYLVEREPLGTAGALGLLPAQDAPLLVVNGDLVAAVPVHDMLRHHQRHGAAITVGYVDRVVPVPYGVLELQRRKVTALHEKPDLPVRIVAGVYVVAPHVVASVAPGRRLDMPDLVARTVRDQPVVGSRSRPLARHRQPGRVRQRRAARPAAPGRVAMTTMLVGLGPAGRGVLEAMRASGVLADVCADGLVVVEPSSTPGGGALGGYGLRSDSAAAVFAECVRAVRDDPAVASSPALATILGLPDGETVALPVVAQLLEEATRPLLRTLATAGAEVMLGARVQAVTPRPGGGAVVSLRSADGSDEARSVDRVVLAVGGEPYLPASLVLTLGPRVLHSDALLRSDGLARTLAAVPADPRVVVVGRAHSAFAVADRLLSSAASAGWGAGAVTVATPGPVRVTYADVDAARADGARFTTDDVCPFSGRVWRLCGLRGDAARRYRLGRDGLDPRLVTTPVSGAALAALAGSADLVVAATGYRSAALRLVPAATAVRPDGVLVDAVGRPLPGLRALGLGARSRRDPAVGGEPWYTGPVDGVWHYQYVVAPALVDGLLSEPLEPLPLPPRRAVRLPASFAATSSAP